MLADTVLELSKEGFKLPNIHRGMVASLASHGAASRPQSNIRFVLEQRREERRFRVGQRDTVVVVSAEPGVI